jgi:hypothetical protein
MLNGVSLYLSSANAFGMYTREEISKQKQAFWTAFGRYMQPIQSADGLPVTWLNYKTGISGIHFKMDASRDHAFIMVQLSHPNPATQQLHYDQFTQLKTLLQETLGETDWTWQPPALDAQGKTTAGIIKTLPRVNIHHQADWSAIISFLKPRLIALDEFWSMVKYSFESLG